MGVVVIVIIKMFLLFLLLLLILSSKRRLISLHCAWFGVSSATNAPSDPGRVQSESQSPSFLRETQARTCTTPWLYTEPSTTRFRLLYSSCRSCYAKRVPSSCHLFACTLLRLVHLLLEEFRISLKSSLSAQSVHSQSHSRNQSPGFLGPASESDFHKKHELRNSRTLWRFHALRRLEMRQEFSEPNRNQQHNTWWIQTRHVLHHPAAGRDSERVITSAKQVTFYSSVC